MALTETVLLAVLVAGLAAIHQFLHGHRAPKGKVLLVVFLAVLLPLQLREAVVVERDRRELARTELIIAMVVLEVTALQVIFLEPVPYTAVAAVEEIR